MRKNNRNKTVGVKDTVNRPTADNYRAKDTELGRESYVGTTRSNTANNPRTNATAKRNATPNSTYNRKDVELGQESYVGAAANRNNTYSNATRNATAANKTMSSYKDVELGLESYAGAANRNKNYAGKMGNTASKTNVEFGNERIQNNSRRKVEFSEEFDCPDCK